jgi:diguanylate cyclase (GGDEF)-like protein
MRRAFRDNRVLLLLAGGALALQFLSVTASALPLATDIDHFDVRTLDVNRGLPAYMSTSLAQTSDGYIWIGTERGLVRYDGLRFTVFDHVTNPELRSRYIAAITIDRTGALLIGTATAGVFRMTNGRFVQVLSAAVGGEAYELVGGNDGTVWSATMRGVFRVRNGVISRYTTREGLPCDSVPGLAKDRHGVIWAGTSCGVARFDGKRFIEVPMSGDFHRLRVSRLMFTRGGALFIGTRNGAAVLENGRVRRVSSIPAISFAEDREGAVWIGTSMGLQRLAPGRDAAATSQRKTKPVMAMLEDREGALWSATADHVDIVRANLFTPISKINGLVDDELLAVTTDPQGRLVFGTDRGGIYRLVGMAVETILPVPTDSRRSIWSVAFGPDGRLWAGGAGDTAFIIDGTKIQHVGARNTIEVLPRADGSAWALGGNGEIVEISASGASRPLQPASGAMPAEVHRIMPARDGGIWITSRDRRLSHLDPQRRLRTIYQGEMPYSVLEDRDGTLWIGAMNAGIIQLRNGRAQSLRQRDGLPDDDIMGITDDGYGFLWISTPAGLARVARQELERFAANPKGRLRAHIYGAADGMPNVTCVGGMPSVTRTSDGMLWFATATGLAGIHPDPARMIAPRMQLDAVVETVDGTWAGPRLLSARRRPLTFQFSAPTSANAARVHFRYKLIGFDDEWVEAGHTRTASYTNIPHGEYRFVVQASAENGPWQTAVHERSTFAFRKARAMHETIWFRALVLLTIGGLIGSAHWWRVRSFRQREVALEATVAERTMLLAQANDSLRRMTLADPLTGIANRRCLDDSMAKEWSRAQRNGQEVAFLFIDVDFFKKYNDLYGHQQGDRCLIEVARCISQSVRRPADLAARYGGEEFAIMLPDTDLEGAHAVAEVVRKLIAQKALAHRGSEVSDHVTLSIGIASAFPSSGMTIAQLIDAADEGVYRAKQHGRNRVMSADRRLKTSAA